MKGRRKPEEEMKMEPDVTMPAIAEPGVTLPETVDPDVTLPATVEPVVAMPATHRNLMDLQAKLAHPGSQLTRAGTQNSTDILDIGNQVLLNLELVPSSAELSQCTSVWGSIIIHHPTTTTLSLSLLSLLG